MSINAHDWAELRPYEGKSGLARLGESVAMNRNPKWYRDEAARLRQRSGEVADDLMLRDRYLALAREYEQLASVLGITRRLAPRSPSVPY
jgi:hypothetical protein